jgi:hypothetical protein
MKVFAFFFSVVTSCGLVGRYCFGETYCLNPHPWRNILSQSSALKKHTISILIPEETYYLNPHPWRNKLSQSSALKKHTVSILIPEETYCLSFQPWRNILSQSSALKKHTISFLIPEETYCLSFQPWKWRQYVSLKCWCVPATPHGVITQNIDTRTIKYVPTFPYKIRNVD